MVAHTLSTGDELFDKTDASFTVTEVHDDGSVTFEIDDGDALQRTATWDEDAVTTALEEGLLADGSGRSEVHLA